MKRKSDQNSKLVYSTNPTNQTGPSRDKLEETLSPAQQNLKVSLDRKQRRGKSVTLVTGFVGPESDLKMLGQRLKASCGVGGTVKNGEILIQGDCRGRVIGLLAAEGYQVKRSGG